MVIPWPMRKYSLGLRPVGGVKMKWRVRKPNARHRRLHWWHDWFAWFPVRVPTNGRMSGMRMAWLEKIERKGKYKLLAYCECGWIWQYR